MLLFILGMGILMLIGGVAFTFFGGNIGRAVGPWLFWGALLVLAVAILAFIIKLAANQDPKIVFDKNKQELTVRGKVIPFSNIASIVHQEQAMMSKTMFFAFMMINGKKKSLFSTAVVAPKPQEMINFIEELSQFVQGNDTREAAKEE